MVNVRLGAIRAGGFAMCAAAIALTGCQTGESGGTGDSSMTTQRADSDRALLAKLVGEWRFSGAWAGADGTNHNVEGRAAGVLVNNYFVMLDVQTTAGQLAGRTSNNDGSMLFAAEPGVGMTVSAWGDASPSITRLVGRADDGPMLTFLPASGPSNAVAMVVRFEGDNQFSTEISGGAGGSGKANYTFTRVTSP
ncbi:MAG: hypothetical protein KF805_01120 [Phycisphaeraceae bacterium]|nr:hypothetical protein [Phycisphaeraceae bacterium]